MALIRGLTLRHPWAWAFLHGKDVENRSWRPDSQGLQVGDFIALHGGKMPPKYGEYWDEIYDAAVWMRHRQLPYGREPSFEEIKAGSPLCVGGIVAVGRLENVCRDSLSLWAIDGQWHWEMDVTVLPEPVPHRGSQGLWEIEPDALAAIRQRYKAARR